MSNAATGGGGSVSLIDPLLPLTNTLGTLIPALDAIQLAMTTLDPALKTTAANLTSGANAKLALGTDFAGQAAQAFQSATTAHLKLSAVFPPGFQTLENGIQTLLDDINSATVQYDNKLDQIAGTNYISYATLGSPMPFSDSPVLSSGKTIQGAYDILGNLQPYSVLVDNVIAATDGNSLLLSGPAEMQSLLANAHARLSGENPHANYWLAATAADLAGHAIDTMAADIGQVYQNWGNAIQAAYTKFRGSIASAAGQIQPGLAGLTQTINAAQLYNMILANWETSTPIQIEQIGPNRILVLIAGTDPTTMNTDANVWNALGTGMGQDMPYEQDVIDAIRQYCAANGLTNPQVVLAGHSLGGMTAEQVAEKHLFDVTQVVTFGSPTMGDPVPGVQYDLYAAKWDWVPMLSHYENHSLPTSLKDATSWFPAFQTNWEGMENPLGGGHSIVHDFAAPFHDLATGWDDIWSASDNVHGLVHVGGVGVQSLVNMPTSGLKRSFMDPNNLYGNSIQIVPDMTSMSPTVHSQYGQSAWLAQQQVVTNVANTGVSTNAQTFGMPNLPSTLKTNQYMSSHFSIPASWLDSMFG